jgi:hemoglobin/transferrin/lactoferrin receptor protein
LPRLGEQDSLFFYYPSYNIKRIAVSQLPALKYEIRLRNSDLATLSIKDKKDNTAALSLQVAQKIDTIPGDFIRLTNGQTTGEVAGSSGKVFVTRDYATGDRFFLRGLGGNRVLLMVDGVPMNNGINPGSRNPAFPGIHPGIIDNAEILSGSGNIRYNGLGGTINLRTKPAKLSRGTSTIYAGDALLRYAMTNQEKTGGFSFAISKKRFGSVSAFYFTDVEEQHIGANRPSAQGDWGRNKVYVERADHNDTVLVNTNPNILKRTEYNQLHGLQKFLFAADSNRLIGLNFQFTRVSPVNHFGQLSQTYRDTPIYTLRGFEPRIHFLVSMTGDIKLQSRIMDELHLNFATQYTTQVDNMIYFGDSIRYSKKEKIQSSTITVNCSKALSSKNELQYGGEIDLNTVFSSAEAEDIMQRKSLLTFSRYPDGGSNMNIFALYIADAWEITNKLTLRGGVRFNRVMLDADYNDTFRLPAPSTAIRKRYSAFTGNIGAAYIPDKGWKISALFASGFRAPDLNELGKTEPLISQVILPNPNLSPEYTYNAELGLSRMVQEKVKVNATIFYTYLEKPIGLRPAIKSYEDGIEVYGRKMQVLMSTNLPAAQLQGVEGSINWQFTKNLSFFSAITYVKERSANSSMAEVPPLYGQSSIRLDIKKFTGYFSAVYNGRKRLSDYNPYEYENLTYALPGQGSPGWSSLNFSGEFAVTKNLKLQAGIKNILDTHYREYGSGISSPGRNIYAALRGSF